MADLMQRLEQHAAAYSLLGEKDLPALLREAAASLRAAPEVEALSESDKEIALAQAVDLAQYVEKNAKGGMREAAKRFLSLSYAQHVAQRLRAAPEWQPIEMAPKDDTPVDLWRPVCGGERLANMRRIELSPGNVFYTAIESGYTCVRDATHWMPLPSPPLAAHLQEQGNG